MLSEAYVLPMSLFRTARVLGSCPVVGSVVMQNFCSTISNIVVSPSPASAWPAPSSSGLSAVPSSAQSFQTSSRASTSQSTSCMNLWERLFSDYQKQLQTVKEPSMQSKVGSSVQNMCTSQHPNMENLVRQFHQTTTSEVKMEAQVIFDSCWRRLEDRYGLANVRCPREVVWLNGAPGAGKGVNTSHILKIRGLGRVVTVSSLLETSPEARVLIDRGEMVPEHVVGDALLDALFSPEANEGVGLVVDGFPRTPLQVDFLKLLHDKLVGLHNKYADSQLGERFPRPSFKVMVLYVDEETSIRRQMERAKLASLHNRRVLDAGAGSFRVERATDISEEKCHKRYEIFKAHYTAILRLKQFFPFHLIDSMGTLAETQASIAQELRYQSSMDLDEETYSAIRHIVLARDLVRSARQMLVKRLEDYCHRHHSLFEATVRILDSEVVPLLRRCGLAGHAEYVTKNPFFTKSPISIDIMIDILSDRGFNCDHSTDELVVPTRFDLQTGEIISNRETIHRFRVTFDVKGVREQYKQLEIAARVAEAASDTRITQSFIPEHADHFLKYKKQDDSSMHRPVASQDAKKADAFERQFGYDDAEDIQVYYDPVSQKA